MPPKTNSGASKKTETKIKQKVIEDKTFGLKNKKGGKQQKFIQQVQKQVLQPNVKASKAVDPAAAVKKKEEEKKKKEELNELFKPVHQVVSKGADPKSVLCAFFKQGACGKGAKCKFSHDLTIERKSEKRSIYEDTNAKEGDEETMDKWDQEKLESVVDTKHGSSNKSLPPTSIICKFFLDAVENGKYGWFWECPNGETCHYRHALPPGFILKKDKKRLEEQKESITLEELIERERASLGSGVTKVTFETFLAWKMKKKAERVQKDKAAQEKKKTDYKSGKMFGFSGRDLFTFNPELVEKDDEEADDAALEREDNIEEEGEVRVREININDFSLESSVPFVPLNVEISVDTGDRFAELKYLLKTRGAATAVSTEDTHKALRTDAAQCAGAGDSDADSDEEASAAIAAAMAATVDGDMPIDENLFADDDLEELDQDLEQLDL